MAIHATQWYSAEWAKQKGLYTEVYESIEELDIELNKFLKTTVSMNPEAMRLLKKVFWKGTDDWDELLAERAITSGKLVLSDFSKTEIGKFLSSK